MTHVYLTAVYTSGRPLADFAVGNMTLHHVLWTVLFCPAGAVPFSTVGQEFLSFSSKEQNSGPVRSSWYKANDSLCVGSAGRPEESRISAEEKGRTVPCGVHVLCLQDSRVLAACLQGSWSGWWRSGDFPLSTSEHKPLPFVFTRIVLKISFRKRVELSAAKKRS